MKEVLEHPGRLLELMFVMLLKRMDRKRARRITKLHKGTSAVACTVPHAMQSIDVWCARKLSSNNEIVCSHSCFYGLCGGTEVSNSCDWVVRNLPKYPIAR